MDQKGRGEERDADDECGVTLRWCIIYEPMNGTVLGIDVPTAAAPVAVLLGHSFRTQILQMQSGNPYDYRSP